MDNSKRKADSILSISIEDNTFKSPRFGSQLQSAKHSRTASKILENQFDDISMIPETQQKSPENDFSFSQCQDEGDKAHLASEQSQGFKVCSSPTML